MTRLLRSIQTVLCLCLVLPLLPVGARAGEVPFQMYMIEDNFPTVSRVEVGDVDNDGDLDIVVLASMIDTVAWFENADGLGGTWNLEYVSFSADGANNLQLVDLDRDGDLDALTLDYTSCDIFWIENDLDGTGDWVEHCHNNAIYHSRWNHAADVDNDGDYDVVSCSITASTIYWFENDTGDPSTATWPMEIVVESFEGPYLVFAADADDDGDTDIITTAIAENNTFFENLDGVGTTWDVQSLDMSISPVEEFGVADIDRNGKTDIYAPVDFFNSVLWWSRDPDWTYNIGAFFGSPVSADAADIDQDGDLDFATLNHEGDRVVWLENDLDGAASWPVHTVQFSFDGGSGIRAGDLDGDGDVDLVGVADNAHDVVWWENLSDRSRRSFRPRRTLSTSQLGAAAVEVLDVDHDGDPDVLAGAYYANAVSWWENVNGDAGIWAARSAPPFTFSGVSCLTTGDMSGNSRPDLVVGSFVGGAVSWCYFKSDIAGWFKTDINTDFHGVKSLFTADFDGDGDVDVADAASGDDKVAWWENDGSGGGWTERNLTPAPVLSLDGANSVHGADLDGDGDMDLLASGYDDDVVRWFESMDYGSSGYTIHMLTSTIEQPTCVQAGDINGDGLPDAVIASDQPGEDTLTWWENKSGGEFTDSPGVIAHDFRVDHFRLADLDRDGDLDILGSSYDHNAAYWWKNASGDGSAWVRYRLPGSLSGAWGVGVGDLNRDGFLDALATGFLDNSVHYWPATHFVFPANAINLLLLE